MKLKKIVVLLITVCMLGGLVACGGNDDTNVSTNDNQIATEDNSSSNNYDVITEEMVRNHPVTDASDFEYELYPDIKLVKITEYIGDDAIVVIPEEIEGCKVDSIYNTFNYFFANDELPHVRGVYFPESIKELHSAFANNSTVEVVIAEGVEVLGEYPFLNCNKLHTLILGENLRKIEGLTSISGVPCLKELYLPESLVEIKEGFLMLASKKAYDEGYEWFDLDFTVKGKSGSYIEQYCKDGGIKFTAVDDEGNVLYVNTPESETEEEVGTSEVTDSDEGVKEEDNIVVPEYPMNLPEDLVIEYNGKSCSVMGKRSFDIMSELGIEDYSTFTWNEEGETTRPIECWLGNGLISTVRVDEIWDGESKLWINCISVGFTSEEDGTSLLGIKYGDDIDAVCQVLGTPHLYTKNREYDMQGVEYITDYWWKDIEMYGDVYNVHVVLWDDVLMELAIYQE